MKQSTRTFSLNHWQKKLQMVPSWLLILVLSLLLLAVIILGVSFGSTPISPGTIAQVLLNGTHLFHFARQWNPYVEVIIWQFRLPVVIGTALVGTALAVAGTLFQAVLRNPLADPYVIGTSAGAQLGVSLALLSPVQVAFFGFGFVQGLAFLGALGTVLFVYFLARTRGRTPI